MVIHIGKYSHLGKEESMESFTMAMLLSRTHLSTSDYRFVSIDLDKEPDCKGKLGLPRSSLSDSFASF